MHVVWPEWSVDVHACRLAIKSSASDVSVCRGQLVPDSICGYCELIPNPLLASPEMGRDERQPDGGSVRHPWGIYVRLERSPTAVS